MDKSVNACLECGQHPDAAELRDLLLAALENLCRLSIWEGASDYDRAQVAAARAAIAAALEA